MKTNDKKSHAYSRRQVLGGSSALAAAGLLGNRPSAAPRAFFGAGGGGGTVFVQIFLRGAMDGLTTVVPHAEGAYYAARPGLAVPPPGQPGGAVDLDGFFGLAPAAAPLLTPFLAGDLAFVHASGSTDPTRSHFDAFARMEFGEPNLPPGTTTGGWLGRFLQQTTPGGVLRAIGAGDILPLTLAGAPGALPIPDFDNFLFPGNPSTAQARVDVLSQAYANKPAPVGPAALGTFASIDLMDLVDFAGYSPANGAQYPQTELGLRMRNIAALIKAGLGVEAITVDFGSWDHHASQGPLNGTMALMLDELARSIEAFHADMQAMLGQVVLVAVSEFGRRLEENSSQGTDHGHGNVMMVLGDGIAGGQVLANWPGLAPGQLDQGDLAVTIDYRDILGEILGQLLGATDLAAIFPQHTFTTHGITV